uniref:Integrase catalytic domain-containing protein n=1 Tax=Tanacetum cinerariifolium TaxID=118510 RepID=A0A6L2LXY0_TANCI|nr:hypothetical protein [Tanacetum cinerariifolium]
MTTPNITSSTEGQMHNNIMAVGSRDRPQMLAPGRYPQWRSRFLRYVDTRPNGESLRKCILSGPYKPTIVLVQVIKATDNSPAVPEHTTIETPTNMSPENKAHFLAEKEAIHLILTGIADDIYLTVYACQTAQKCQRSISSTTSAGMVKRYKDMQKNLALIAKYFKKIYKPTNNNLRTSLNSKNKNVDTTLRFKNDNQSGQVGNQRTEYEHFAKECRKPKRIKDSAYHKEKMLCKQAEQGVLLQAEQYNWLADTDEEVNEQELEAHYSYMAKIQEVPTADSRTDSEPFEQVQNNAGYNVFANDLQHSEQSESVSNTCLMETDDSNVTPNSPDMCEDDIQNEQNDVESDDERVALANLKLNVVENKKIQKQLKKANTTLAQELKECKTILAETSKSLRESISVRESCLVALQTKQTEFEKYKAFNDYTVDYDKLEHKLNEALGQLAHKDIVIREGLKTKAYELSVVKEKHDELMKQNIDDLESDKAEFSDMYDEILQDCVSKDVMCSYLQSLSDLDALAELQCMYLHKVQECDCLAQNLLNQTDSVSKEVHTKLLTRFVKLEKHFVSLELNLQKCKEQAKNDTVWNEKASNGFRKEREQYIEIQDLKAKLQDKNIAISHLKKLIEKDKGKSVDTKFDRPSVVRQPNAQRIPKPSVLEKPALFSDSLERRNFPKTKSVPKTNVSEGLSKPVTAQTLSQTARQAMSNTNVLKPRMYRIDNRPQLKSNQSRDKVLPNSSQVKVKKTQVKVHPRIPSVSNKMKYVSMCKDNLNSRTLNANAVCATCNICLVDSNHFTYVTKLLNGVHARTKKRNVVPISTRKPQSQANKFVVTHHKKKVASKSTNQKLQSYFGVLYENTNKTWKWWIERQSPSGYKRVPKQKKQWVPKLKRQWVPKDKNDQVQKRIVQLILFIVDSGCTKHMTGNLKLLCNFVDKFLGLNHNLFSVGQFCDADLEVAFRKSTCFVRDLQGNDLLVDNHGSDLYTISLQESTLSTPLCLMAKATPTQAWLWHQRLSHLNFDYINLLSKKDIVIGLPKLNYTLFLRSKDETPEVLKDFLMMIQRNPQTLVITIRTDRGTEFLNKTLNAFFREEGIKNQTSTARTPEQNGVVERRNRTLVEDARTMLSAS